MTRKEAIKILMGYYHTPQESAALEVLIPELRESEDERMLRTIIRGFESWKGNGNMTFNNTKVDDILAYLEKQKEQKPAERSLEDDHIIGFVYDLLNEIEWKDSWAMSKDECLRLLSNYIPEKPAEWSEDWREEDIQTRFAFYTYKDDSSVLYLSNVFVEETSRNHGFGTRILKAAEKVAETIGATTISLKVKQDSYANAWYRKNGYGYVAFEDGYDWLEKNLEYMKPNKQEWSEEDELNCNRIIRFLEPHKTFFPTKETKEEMKNWLENRLKSLRPQPHWKPSEHQMSMLLAVVNDPNNAGSESCHLSLKSLYNDLKKL